MARDRGLLDRPVRYRVGNGCTLDVPISRPETSWTRRDVLDYDPLLIDDLVAAVGRPELITAEHVGEDSVVIDVGTNPTPDGGLVGDVDAGSVTGRAAGLTPVPGGVGPVTTALLLQHTLTSARR